MALAGIVLLLMKCNWINQESWIVHFDILGFQEAINRPGEHLAIRVLQSKIDDVIEYLKLGLDDFHNRVGYILLSDTFLIYSKTSKVEEYPIIVSLAKRFINKCISIKLPVRGAVSFGEMIIGYDERIFMGKAFLESHQFGEDQNWLGLLLTPSATEELYRKELFPIRHGFVDKDIPLRKYAHLKNNVYAYTFINGSTNFQCPLLRPLEEMMKFACDEVKPKYRNTINFIESYYRIHTSN